MATGGGGDQVWTWEKPPPLSKEKLRNVFETTSSCSHLCMLLHIPFLKWSVESAVEYYSESTEPRKVRNLIFQLDMMGDTDLADSIMEYAEPPADLSLKPHLLTPVFTAITGDWAEIGRKPQTNFVQEVEIDDYPTPVPRTRPKKDERKIETEELPNRESTITATAVEDKLPSHTTVPRPRAFLLREKFSGDDAQVRAEAGKYYALYHPDPSWTDLSLALSRARETKAVELAIQIITEAKSGVSPLTFRPPFQAGEKPKMSHLLEFPTAFGDIDVTAKVGMKYEKLGTLLLNDYDGTVMPTIVFECQQKTDKITLEIMRRWLAGKGKQPVTWWTLTKSLKTSGLLELAASMEKSFRF